MSDVVAFFLIMIKFRIYTCAFWSFALLFQSSFAVEEIDVLVVYSEVAKNVLLKKSANKLASNSEFLIEHLNHVISKTNLKDIVHFNVADSLVYDYDLKIPEAAMTDGMYLERQQNGLTLALNDLAELLPFYRNRANADIVLYVADYPCRISRGKEKNNNALGMGRGYSLEREKEYLSSGLREGVQIAEKHYIAIVNYLALLDNLRDNTVGHEIGHLLGCGHSDTQSFSPGPYYYCDSCGIHDENRKDATLMGYKYKDDSCAVKYEVNPYFSSYYPAPYINGNLPDGEKKRLEGDVMHNNAAAVMRNAPLLSHFRLSGNEALPNMSYKAPIMMPPMVNNRIFLAGLLNPKLCDFSEALDVFSSSFPRIREKKMLFSTIYGTNAFGEVKEKSERCVWYELLPPCHGLCFIGIRKFGTRKHLSPRIRVYDDCGKSVGKVVPKEDLQGLECALYAPAMENSSLYISVETGMLCGGQFSLFASLDPMGHMPPVKRPFSDCFKGGLRSYGFFSVAVLTIISFICMVGYEHGWFKRLWKFVVGIAEKSKLLFKMWMKL